MLSDKELTEELIKTIPFRSSDSMTVLYKEEMNKADVSISLYEVSLICPISHTPMTRPLRGRECKHFQSMEAYFFIKTGCVVIGNGVVIKVQCPLCSASYQDLSDLFIDGMQQKIVQSHPIASSATIHPDGSYSIQESVVVKEEKEDVIDLTAYQDEPVLIDLT